MDMNTYMNTHDALMQNLHAHILQERSQHTLCEKEGMPPVAMEHYWKGTYRHTPTHDRLSILGKVEQSFVVTTNIHMHMHTHTYAHSINPCPIKKQKKLQLL